ncbi:MAG: SGNH/GDSL hydrolase family protein [Propionibacteriales bacterium]|nr:SGNH/GDSL hydrolase family protein [Propionibacteriales bacterium]
MSFRRYVAIGDSATEGLEDPDPQGGYRGWADRLAMIIAAAQPEPLEYANLAVRGLVAAEVRATQFDAALAMQPDLLTITAGVNDCLGVRADLEAVAEHLAAMWSEARDHDITVVGLTMPDPRRINPLIGKRLRDRVLRLNEIQRVEAERYGVLLLDLEASEMAGDPRLWFEDRLHGNAVGHDRVARGMAWTLGIEGYDLSWADPLAESEEHRIWRDRVQGDLSWARQHFGPWLVKNLRGIRHGDGISAKRPTLQAVEQIDHADAETMGRRSLDESSGGA